MRKRIKRNGTLMASSNGRQTHLRREQLRELEKDFQKQMELYHKRVKEGYEWETDEPAVLRGESMVMEEYSDKLWDLGLHTESLLRLMQAAAHLIDWDEVVIGSELNYYHRSLSRFRYLFSRCQERVREEPELEPLLSDSSVADWYEEMEQRYAGCKVTGWIS
jgi:hypothetical protein